MGHRETLPLGMCHLHQHAPDLLAACEAIADVLEEHVQYDDGGKESGEVMGLRLIRAAIKKAKAKT
jgi:hypothetical protein